MFIVLEKKKRALTLTPARLKLACLGQDRRKRGAGDGHGDDCGNDEKFVENSEKRRRGEGTDCFICHFSLLNLYVRHYLPWLFMIISNFDGSSLKNGSEITAWQGLFQLTQA